LSSCIIAAVAPLYLPAFFPWRAVASREGCFALARRSFFFRRFARFLALSLPLLCPIGLTFVRFSTESKASDRDKPTRPVKPRKARDRRWWELAKPGELCTDAKLSQLWR